MSTVFERLREERERLGLVQTDMAEIGGVKKQSQINYESGKRKPDSEYLAAVAERGVDITYVLTGHRVPAVVRLVQKQYGDVLEVANNAKQIASELTGHSVDTERLLIAIRVVETALSETSRKVDPGKKAEIILAAFELLGEMNEGAEQKIIRLVKAA